MNDTPLLARVAGAPRRALLRPPLALVLFNGLVALVVGVLSWEALDASHEVHQRRGVEAAANIAHGVASAIGAQIGRIDTVMQSIAIAVAHEGGPDAPASAVLGIIEARRRLVPEVAGLRVANAQGGVIGGDIEGRPVNLGDRDYFQRLRAGPSDLLVVADPVKSRISGQWVLVLGRRIEAADGSFAGAVLATLNTTHFDALFAGVELGEQGSIVLRSGSMALVTRRAPGDESPLQVGATAISPQLRDALAASPDIGNLVSASPLDGVERVSSYHRVAGTGLLVIAGLAEHELLAPWRSELNTVLLLDALLLVLLASSSVLMWRAWRGASASQRQAQRAARRYQALMHTASDGVHVLDHDGRIVELSESFAAMLGYRREEMLGLHVSQWDAQIPRDELDRSLREFRVGDREDFETRHRRRDGSVIEVEVSSVGVEVDGQELLFCAARDLSARRRAEQTQRALQQEQALREQAERHAGELGALLRERSDMLDVLAHEVRQPLNNASAALQSAAQSLAATGDTQVPQRITRAQIVLGHVMSSIDNTLAVASLLARPGPIDRADTDIDMLLGMSLGDIAGGERRRVDVEHATTVRTASMDLGLMRLALRNLVANALKYSPPGSPVTVRISDGDDPLELHIDVIDRGPGIAREQVPTIFERGVRGRQPGHPGGLGLGLYIVRRVMEMHGGRVEVVGHGAEGFTMRLVLVDGADDRDEAEEEGLDDVVGDDGNAGRDAGLRDAAGRPAGGVR